MIMAVNGYSCPFAIMRYCWTRTNSDRFHTTGFMQQVSYITTATYCPRYHHILTSTTTLGTIYTGLVGLLYYRIAVGIATVPLHS